VNNYENSLLLPDHVRCATLDVDQAFGIIVTNITDFGKALIIKELFCFFRLAKVTL
jgi:hypothetical protein